jgi:hypothetical protein
MTIELNKEFAIKLSAMLEARLIWYKHYFIFCDEIIDKYDYPPYWIIELSITKYLPDAIRIVKEYAYSEPFEQSSTNLNDYYIGCIFVKYLRKEISWATFLEESGKRADSSGAVKEECEYFYYMLNDLEDSHFSAKLEEKQMKYVRSIFQDEIYDANRYNTFFNKYFNEYIARAVNHK